MKHRASIDVKYFETCRTSHQATNLLSKYNISKLYGGGSRLALIMLTQVQNQKKLADVILEHSLRWASLSISLAPT